MIATVYAKAQRPRTLATLERLRIALEPYLRMLWTRSEYKTRSQDDHLDLLNLCRAGDVSGAQRALASHISQTGEAIVKLLRGQGG